MANNKRRTTMAKLNRETRLREKRYEKEARKAARKLEAGDPDAADPYEGAERRPMDEPADDASRDAA